MNLSTANAVGFSDNTQDVINFSTVYRDIVQNDTAITVGRYSASVNNLFSNGSGLPYIAKWAWYKLFHLLPDAFNAKLSINANNVNGEGLSATRSIQNMGFDLGMSLSPNPTQPTQKTFRLNILRVNRGITNTFTVLDAKEDELHRLKDLELPFILSQHHKVRLYRDNVGSITMITNQYEPEKTFWQMFGMLPIFYPEIKAIIEQPENEEMRNIFKAFYECNGEAFKPYITRDFASIEKLKELRNITKFEQALKNIGKRQITALEDEIANLQHNIDSFYTNAKNYDAQLQDKKRALTGLNIMGSTVDHAALDFLKNSKKISIVGVETNAIVFKVVTPLANYVKQDMESYYRHDAINYVTETPWIASLLKETFIEEKYQFVLTTIVRAPLDSNGNWQITRDNSDYTGNPHLTKYDCYTPARNMMNKFLNEGRILDMINQLIATCASINVVDGSVMRAFINEIENDYTFDHPIIQNIETGEFMTPHEYKTAYTNAAKATN